MFRHWCYQLVDAMFFTNSLAHQIFLLLISFPHGSLKPFPRVCYFSLIYKPTEVKGSLAASVQTLTSPVTLALSISDLIMANQVNPSCYAAILLPSFLTSTTPFNSPTPVAPNEWMITWPFPFRRLIIRCFFPGLYILLWVYSSNQNQLWSMRMLHDWVFMSSSWCL